MPASKGKRGRLAAREAAKREVSGRRRPNASAAPTGETCGDYGGVGDYGSPCQQPAGAGTDQSSGRCKFHDDNAVAAEKIIKENFLAKYALQPMTVREAAEKAGSNITTIWKLRNADPEFDEAVDRLKRRVKNGRIEMVEDALFVRCASAKGNPTETIFWLVNMTRQREDGGHRWTDARHHELSGPNGAPIPVESSVRQVVTFAGKEIEM